MFMSEAEISEAFDAATRMLPGSKARSAASVFNYGNILAILVPLPLGML
jgi:predicted MFS family arabinose efflux permease